MERRKEKRREKKKKKRKKKKRKKKKGGGERGANLKFKRRIIQSRASTLLIFTLENKVLEVTLKNDKISK